MSLTHNAIINSKVCQNFFPVDLSSRYRHQIQGITPKINVPAGASRLTGPKYWPQFSPTWLACSVLNGRQLKT
jgi:hypothetical protein